MGEGFPGTAEAIESDTVHDLTTDYMDDLSAGRLNEFDVCEDLACKVAADEINEATAEAVAEYLGVEEATFED
jgi:hypothetical protein